MHDLWFRDRYSVDHCSTILSDSESFHQVHPRWLSLTHILNYQTQITLHIPCRLTCYSYLVLACPFINWHWRDSRKAGGVANMTKPDSQWHQCPVQGHGSWSSLRKGTWGVWHLDISTKTWSIRSSVSGCSHIDRWHYVSLPCIISCRCFWYTKECFSETASWYLKGKEARRPHGVWWRTGLSGMYRLLMSAKDWTVWISSIYVQVRGGVCF